MSHVEKLEARLCGLTDPVKSNLEGEANSEGLAITMDVIGWYEAEESCRGMALQDLLTGIGRLTHSGKWHWQQERPETNNPIWPIFTV